VPDPVVPTPTPDPTPEFDSIEQMILDLAAKFRDADSVARLERFFGALNVAKPVLAVILKFVAK